MEFRDSKGIYLQIADQIRERILMGDWNANERISSVRDMAVNLGVNPNTVARSYQTLVDREILVNERGRGYFISENAVERIKEDLKQEFLLEELPRIFRTMKLLGIEPEEISARFIVDNNP